MSAKYNREKDRSYDRISTHDETPIGGLYTSGIPYPDAPKTSDKFSALTKLVHQKRKYPTHRLSHIEYRYVPQAFERVLVARIGNGPFLQADDFVRHYRRIPYLPSGHLMGFSIPFSLPAFRGSDS